MTRTSGALLAVVFFTAAVVSLFAGHVSGACMLILLGLLARGASTVASSRKVKKGINRLGMR